MQDTLERIIKILKYDIKTNEKEVYERDTKEILEMLTNLTKNCECSDCKKEFELNYGKELNCPYCGSGDVIIYE